MSDLRLWVHPDPFCFGILFAHPKLSKVYLKRVISYARSKGSSGGYPRLSWSIWKHMATNKMLLRENLAWTYFEVYNTVKECTWEERLQDAEVLQQSHENGDIEGYESQVEVHTLEFLLLLYIQQAARMSLRASLVGEEWPGSSPRSRSPSPDLLESGKTSGIPSIMDEANHLQFVLSHLTDILELLAEPEKEKGEQKNDRRLSIDAVRSLGFLIKVYIPKLKNMIPLDMITMRHRFQSKSGFSRTTNDFSCRVFEDWLRSNLEQNPFGVAACISSGVKLKWSIAQRGRSTVPKRCQIQLNSQTAPSNQKMIFISHCSNQTIARQSSALTGSCVKINKCNQSQLYLLSPLRYVSIEKCQNSIFTFGPIVSCIRIIGCHNVTVIAPSRSIVISTSRNITAHIAVSTKPIIVGDSSMNKGGSGDSLPPVTLAPYHTYYSHLEKHLASVGLVISPQINQWNNPICLTNTMASRAKTTSSAKLPRRRTEGSEEDGAKMGIDALYRILPASEFFSFSIPFKLPSRSLQDFPPTTAIPWELPIAYTDAIKQKQKAVAKYKTAVRGSKMTSEERKSFQDLIEKQFKDWLEETGNKRQLDDLVELTKAFEDSKKKP